MTKASTALARWWRYANPSGPNECWVWSGKTDTKGYGAIFIEKRDGKSFCKRAHRFGYEMLVGPIPEGLDLDHLCRNRPCVNPTHLEPVTRKVNLRRGPTVLSTVLANRAHCLRGHPLSGENLWVEKTGYRHCKRCHADREAAKRARKRQSYAPAPDLTAVA